MSNSKNLLAVSTIKNKIIILMAASITLISIGHASATIVKNKKTESHFSHNPHPIALETLQIYLPYFLQNSLTIEKSLIIGEENKTTIQSLVDIKINNIDLLEYRELDSTNLKTVTVIDKHHGVKHRNIVDYYTHALIDNKQKYDIISSNFSPKSLSSITLKQSIDFFTTARSHLNNDGIMTQWISLGEVNTPTLKILLTTFYLTFPNGFTIEHKLSNNILLIGATKKLTFDSQATINKFNQKSIRTSLNAFNIQKPEDIFWFFQLSRDRILNSMLGNEYSTNITHLKSNKDFIQYLHANNEQSPVFFLSTLCNMDISPFVTKGNEKNILFTMGINFLDWGDPSKLALVSSRLKSISPLQSDALQHEIYYWENNFTMATKLYNNRDNWPEFTNFRQADMEARKKDRNLNRITKNISSATLKQNINAKIYFTNKDWKSLVNLTPLNVVSERWRLVGLVYSGGIGALERLTKLTPATFENIVFLEILEKIFKERNEMNKSDWMKNQLKTLHNLRLKYFELARNLKLNTHHKKRYWEINMEQISGKIASS